MLLAFFGLVQTSSALTFGDFTYTDDGSSVTITGFPASVTGSIAIPDSIDGKPVTAIGYRAFFSCSGLVGVTVPSSVTSVAAEAFYQCSGLVSMTLPSGVTVIPDNAFSGCISLASVNLTGNVTSIGASSFYHCIALTDITLPSTVTSIGGNAFAECSLLSSVSLSSSLATVGGFAFNKCTALTSITLPGAVTTIQTSAFEDCTALSNVTFSNGLLTLQPAAFRRCTALVGVSLPASLTSIASDAFSRCTGLTSIQVDASNTALSASGGVLFNKTATTLLIYPAGRSGSYSIPSGVTSVGNNAFRFAANLTAVTIPQSVNSLGTDAFGSCPSLMSLAVDSANTAFSSTGGVVFDKSGNTLRFYPTGLTGAYVIPSGVTTISSAAFRSSLSLTAVTIPATVTSLATDSFATCGSLSSATFQGNAPSMGQRVFQAAAANFKVLFYPGATGFANPWNGYVTEEIGGLSPAATWLQAHSLPADSSLSSDSNGDGVNLLMAYALNLDPARNLSASLPQTVIASGNLSMTFYGAAQGVTYSAQVSSDLVSWSSNGVAISPPDSNQRRTATCNRSGSQQFMRLVVSY